MTSRAGRGATALMDVATSHGPANVALRGEGEGQIAREPEQQQQKHTVPLKIQLVFSVSTGTTWECPRTFGGRGSGGLCFGLGSEWGESK